MPGMPRNPIYIPVLARFVCVRTSYNLSAVQDLQKDYFLKVKFIFRKTQAAEDVTKGEP